MRLTPLLLALVFVAMLTVTAQSAPPHPNVILILADDMGYSDAGCYGSEIPTPGIDKLAAEGVMCLRAYTAPRCSPSRAGLMTGMYAQRVGVGHLDKPLPNAQNPAPGYVGTLSRDYETMAEILHRQGYGTYMAGKWHLGTDEGKIDTPVGPHPWQRGFQYYRGLLGGASSYFSLPAERNMGQATPGRAPRFVPHAEINSKGDFYMTKDITSTAVGFLRDALATPDKPFFLYVAYTAPHSPLEAPDDSVQKMLPLYQDKDSHEIYAARLARQAKLGIIPTGVAHTKPASAKDARAKVMATYAAQVADMDAGIEELLRVLDASARKHDTIVIFASDNGATAEGSPPSHYGGGWAQVSNAPFRGFKISTKEGGISVPCLVRYPAKIGPKTRTTTVMHLIDVLPTCLHWAGIAQTKPMDGISQATVLEQATALTSDPWLPVIRGNDKRILFFEHQGNRAAFLRGYKFVAQRGQEWHVYSQADRLESAPLLDIEWEEMERAYNVWADKNYVNY